jgi:hypothetical protein
MKLFYISTLFVFSQSNLVTSTSLADLFENVSPISVPGQGVYPNINQVPSGTMTRRLTLPSAFEFQPNYAVDWKYFFGILDVAGDSQRKLDFLSTTVRYGSSDTDFTPNAYHAIVGLLRLHDTKTSRNNQTITNSYYSLGYKVGGNCSEYELNQLKTQPFSPQLYALCSKQAEDYSFGFTSVVTSYVDFTNKMIVKFDYVLGPKADLGFSAPLGSIGARYKLSIYDSKSGTEISLNLRDERGTVFQGSSGTVATRADQFDIFSKLGIASMSDEYSNPRLRVLSGNVTYSDGEVLTITGGNVFLDHQRLGPQPGKKISNLYDGTWISLWLNDGRSYTLFTSVNKSSVVTTALAGSCSSARGSVYENFGTLYKPWENSIDTLGQTLEQKLFGLDDFTVNPVSQNKITKQWSQIVSSNQDGLWTSPTTQRRYGTTYKIVVRKENKPPLGNTCNLWYNNNWSYEIFYIKPFFENGEIRFFDPSQDPIYEGGVEVFTPNDLVNPIGYGVLEQFGNN